MSNSLIRSLLGTQSDLNTEIIVPQLEYLHSGFRSAGIPPIRFGDLFRSIKGREPKPNETVKFIFQDGVKYRGAFGWVDRPTIVNNGTSYSTVPKPRASFLLGDGWLPGQTPAQIELYIPPNTLLMGASGASKRQMTNIGSYVWGSGISALTVYTPEFSIDTVPSAIFSLKGTEAFINPTTPLIFNHHGKIFAAGGTGASQFANQSIVIAPAGVYQAAGGNGKGWPTSVYPMDDLATRDIFEESIADSAMTHTKPLNALNRPNMGKPATITQERSPKPTEYLYCNTWIGAGGSWGRVGQGVLFTKMSRQGNQQWNAFIYNPNKGGLPGFVFDLANFTGNPDIHAEAAGAVTTGTRFPNWSVLSSCLDFSLATGEINLGTPEQWKTAPTVNGPPGNNLTPNNLSWSWRQAMYSDCWGLQNTKLFGSAYNPIEGYGEAPLSSHPDHPLVDPYRN